MNWACPEGGCVVGAFVFFRFFRSRILFVLLRLPVRIVCVWGVGVLLVVVGLGVANARLFPRWVRVAGVEVAVESGLEVGDGRLTISAAQA
jgi:hypothetical protein